MIHAMATAIANVQAQWNHRQKVGERFPFLGGRSPSRTPKKKLSTASKTRKPAEAAKWTVFTVVSPSKS
jgi:hypothetical protein